MPVNEGLTQPDTRTVAGIDGCRSGWAVVAGPSARRASCQIVPSPEALDRFRGILAIDMPMGFPDEGTRACEMLARERLPTTRKSSVFPVPPRAALNAATFEDALAIAHAKSGRGISKQSFNLFPKMRELDAWIRARKRRAYEAHPELAFARLAKNRALAPKRTPEGRAARMRLLRAEGFTELEEWIERFPRSRAQPDDILDAAALWLTAARIRDGEAESLPARAPRDAYGIAMRIWV